MGSLLPGPAALRVDVLPVGGLSGAPFRVHAVTGVVMVSSGLIQSAVWLVGFACGLLLVDRLAVRGLRGQGLDSEDRTALTWLRRAVKAVVLVVVFGFAVGLWPYRWEYHSYQPVSGTVEEYSPRFTSDGTTTIESFAVRFTGNGTVYRCDDTRCALVNPGDRLVLRCKREYEWATNNGYGCRFVWHTPRPVAAP